MNSKLLLRVRSAILAHPDQFEMSEWFGNELYFGREFKRRKAGGCGTAACIAGWACHIELKNKTLVETANHAGVTASNRAAKFLNLTRAQALRLFFRLNWPMEYYEQSINATTHEARARAAADRIDWFLKTRGAE